MTNPTHSARRIIGVRTSTGGPLLFCEAGEFSPQPGEWVLVEGESGNFPARVALPCRLIESSQLESNLPKIMGLAGETDLLEAQVPSAVETAVSRKFGELSASQTCPYTLKEVTAFPDRLIVKFTARQEPTGADYVFLLKTLAVVARTRIELFLVSEESLPDKPPAGPEPEFVGWVNGLLKPLDPAVLAGSVVGEPLLDESQVYRPSARSAERPKEQVPRSEAETPTATYEQVGKIRVNGVELVL